MFVTQNNKNKIIRFTQAAFKENNIDGKKLIFINCQTLPSINITDFDHMKVRTFKKNILLHTRTYKLMNNDAITNVGYL